MLLLVIFLSAICTLARGSGVAHGIVGDLHVAPEPIVAAQSSQYFQRTFNRLVALPHAIPVAPEPVIPRAPVAPPPPVVVEPVIRTVQVNQNQPVDPNVAVAIATAHAAAPVATILLPRYPFGFIPNPQGVTPDEDKSEATTTATTKAQGTTSRESEPTTPLPLASNNDNSFAQPLPSNQNVNFNYGPPHQQQNFPPQQQQSHFQPQQQQPQPQQQYPLPLPNSNKKPQKLRTSVEIVPVPLQYIAPPPIRTQRRPVKIVHSFVPASAKIIIRPVSAPLRVRTVRIPARLVQIRTPVLVGRQPVLQQRSSQQGQLSPRETEPTTFSPLNRPITKPPRK